MRIQSIDYLRGVMSLSIVFYHFAYQFIFSVAPDSSELLGRIGIYAVSSFYIISGMALFLAHKDDSWYLSNYIKFILKRFLRIAPVYWVAMTLVLLFGASFIKSYSLDAFRVAINYLLLFGIIDTSKAMVMGGWSIGNEVVFYILFPIFIILSRNMNMLIVMGLAVVASLVLYAFYYLDPNQTLARQWASYINPFNQIYFFVSGVVMARLLLPKVGYNKPRLYFMLALLFMIFAFYPASGNTINIVTGWNKLFFCLTIMLICSVVFLIKDVSSCQSLHVGLRFLGDISYPLYLLHGVSFSYFSRLIYNKDMSQSSFIFSSILLMLFLIFVSWGCHLLIEKPIIKISKVIRLEKSSHS